MYKSIFEALNLNLGPAGRVTLGRRSAAGVQINLALVA
jgi:hypothetical protein